MKRTLLLMLLLLGIAAKLPAYTRITSTTGKTPKWTSTPVPYWINESGAPDIVNKSDVSAVRAAFQTWQSVSSANIQFDYQGTTPESKTGKDGKNLITFIDRSLPLGPSVIAVTLSFFKDDGDTYAFEEADIVFNPLFDFATDGDANKYDIQAIATHEIGHFLGLDHSGLLSAVMRPSGTPGDVSPRILTTDDIAGVSEIYPRNGQRPEGFTISGTVTRVGRPVFGAQVVALDQQGSVLLSTLSRKDGTYDLRGLTAASYRVYAEPLDGPVGIGNIGGANGYFGSINTQFETTYFGGSDRFSQAQAINVPMNAGAVADIEVLGRPSAALNMVLPGSALSIARGSKTTIIVGGFGFDITATYAASDPTIDIKRTSLGRIVGSVAAGALLEVTVPSAATFGPKNLIVTQNNLVSVLSGAIVVVEAAPTVLSFDPRRVPVDGGTLVNLTAGNLKAGLRVYVGGLPATDLSFNGGVLQFRTPPGNIGPANILLLNTDGASTLTTGGLVYTGPAPRITAITPDRGSPGTGVIIEGDNFSYSPGDTSISFGGQSASVLRSSPQRIQTTVPVGAKSGPLTLRVFDQESVGPQFTVIDAVTTNKAPQNTNFVSLDAGNSDALDVSDPDDGLAFATLSIPFTFYRDAYLPGSVLTISTNGWFSFERTNVSEYTNPPSLPASVVRRPNGLQGVVPAALVAPFFDDLLMKFNGTIRAATVGEAPNRQFIVQWSHMTTVSDYDEDLRADLTFEAILYEGSNDIKFAYQNMTGPRSNGESATVGIQDRTRTIGITTGSLTATIYSGGAFVFRYSRENYTVTPGANTPPTKPQVNLALVYDRAGTPNFVAGFLSRSESPIIGYDLTVSFKNARLCNISGSLVVYTTLPPSCGGSSSPSVTTFDTTVRVTDNFYQIIAQAIPDQEWVVSVVATNIVGLQSETATTTLKVSDWMNSAEFIFPSLPTDSQNFSGIALLAPLQTGAGSTGNTKVLIRAVLPDGTTLQRQDALNPITLDLKPGEQWARLVSELFGEPFQGWIQVQSPSKALKVYGTSGSKDLRLLDGYLAKPGSADFILPHGGEFVIANTPAVATPVVIARPPGAIFGPIPPVIWTNVLNIQGGSDAAPVKYAVTAATSRTFIIRGPVRVQSDWPVAAYERFGNSEKLALGMAIPVSAAQSSIVFPHAVVGGGYDSPITLVNPQTYSITSTVTFNGATKEVRITAGSFTKVLLSEVVSATGAALTGAVYVESKRSSDPSQPASLVGSIDIESDTTLVTLQNSPAATDFSFAHVAYGGGLFTGLALATGDDATTFTIEVFKPTGGTPYRTTVTLAPRKQTAQLINEFMPEITPQNGGYIHVTSSKPAWAWGIFGSADVMASLPSQ